MTELTLKNLTPQESEQLSGLLKKLTTKPPIDIYGMRGERTAENDIVRMLKATELSRQSAIYNIGELGKNIADQVKEIETLNTRYSEYTAAYKALTGKEYEQQKQE